MELRYTPKTINEIEVENNNVSFSSLIGDIRLKMVAMWVKKGLNLKTDEEAFKEIDNYFNEGGDLQSLYIEILKALQKGGFVDREKDIEKTLSDVREGKIDPSEIEKKV
jgi:hypothetical protein